MNRLENFKSQMIDDLGRVLLSGELRKKMDWKTGDALSMCQLDENTLILRLSEKCTILECVICRNNDGTMVSVNGVDVCSACVEAVRKL